MDELMGEYNAVGKDLDTMQRRFKLMYGEVLQPVERR